MKLTYKLVREGDSISSEPASPAGRLGTAARKIFSVSDLTRDLRITLEERFTAVWVEGEVCNFKRHTSGHFYFSLKDESAQLGCVMFRRENSSLPFEPQDGLKVVCYGRVSVYAPRGQYQLYVERIEPKGLGALQLRFEQMKEKLKLEGLFDEARKRPIPFLPRRIALITSIDGAALRDILAVIDRRHPRVNLRIVPVAVQGQGATLQIAGALDDVNREDAADVILVARGGGSLEDLWAFNEEAVARAIFRSNIPVISAVGHEVDFTIADFVADLRAATPSAAAELVLPPERELSARVVELKSRALSAVTGEIEALRERLEALAKNRVLRDPLAAFQASRQRFDELTRALVDRILLAVAFKRERIGALAGKLDALGPLSTLRRGFSVTLKLSSGRVVRSSKELKPGDRVRTRLAGGSFVSQVEECDGSGS